MALTYKWTIEDVILGGLPTSDTISCVNWTLEAVDGKKKASISGMSALPTPSTPLPTPKADLTDEDIIGFVEGSMSAENLAEIKENLKNSLAVPADD
jgi:hypothetical protein